MKRTKKNQTFRGVLLTLALVFGIFLCNVESALAAGTAKVVASSGKIRSAADTSSETMASVKKGDKLDVIASKKDGSGYTWYKVYINDKDTGYIRADLVTVEGTISEEKASSSTTSSTSTSETTPWRRIHYRLPLRTTLLRRDCYPTPQDGLQSSNDRRRKTYPQLEESKLCV